MQKELKVRALVRHIADGKSKANTFQSSIPLVGI